MLLTEQKTGTENLAPHSESHLSCNSTIHGPINSHLFPGYFSCVCSTLVDSVGILTPSKHQTISELSKILYHRRINLTKLRRSSFSILLYVIVAFCLLGLLPTVHGVGLGLTRKQRSPPQQMSPSSPFHENERPMNTPLEEDQTIKIRTRDVENAPLPVGSGVDPWLYNVPPVEPTSQQLAFVPAFVPNYHYYTVYRTWDYPEARVVGPYGAQASQWSPRMLNQNRRKANGKRRKDKYKGERCPKFCESCIRSHEGIVRHPFQCLA